MKSVSFLLMLIGLSVSAIGQSIKDMDLTFSRSDSLRGALRPERTCYDVKSYNLNLSFDFENESIKGYNDIFFEVKNSFRVFQIDLFENLIIDSITHGGFKCSYKREFNAVFVELRYEVSGEHHETVRVYYHGSPIKAKRPPWDGGFCWSTMSKNEKLVSVACEGLGASSWWPNKDHLSDEPDSMNISLTVPKPYMAVSNGILKSTKINDKTNTYNWHVSYPINNYNVTFYLGNFYHFSDKYKDLELDFYVDPFEKKKAKKHFPEQVEKMLVAFEHYFGPYPFKNDGYKLVSAPYWGMEHQSAIAYGHNFTNNKYGFDYIIVHESGHEWWGNNVGAKDHADLWLHEAFCTYSEALYVEYYLGKEMAIEYVNEQKQKITNEKPIAGLYNVNYNDFGGADMYYKGTNVLHTLRTLLEDDDLWFSILKGIQKKYAYQTVTSTEIINYINQRTAKDFTDFFNQYLNYANPPQLEYVIERRKNKNKAIIHYKYTTELKEFDMPIRYSFGNEKYFWLYPKSDWKQLELSLDLLEKFELDTENFMIYFKRGIDIDE